MIIKDIRNLVGKRQLAAIGILAVTFAVLMAFQLGVWSFVVVAVLFIGYASWSVTAYLATQGHFSGRSITACVWPVGFAIVQALVCLGVVWLIVWSVRHVFGR